MAVKVRESVKAIWCERIQDHASLIEERVYLGDSLADSGTLSYRVNHRECSRNIECNLRGCQCRWSFLNPEYDPYFETPDVEKQLRHVL